MKITIREWAWSIGVSIGSLFFAGCGDETHPQQAAIYLDTTPVPKDLSTPSPRQPVSTSLPRGTGPDGELEARVRDALLAASRELAQGIGVSASNGVVRLSGTVRTIGTRRRAQEIAASLDEVTSIENKIVVDGGP